MQVYLTQARQHSFQDIKQLHIHRKADQDMPGIQADRQIQFISQLERQLEGEFDGLDRQAAAGQAGFSQDGLDAEARPLLELA